MDFEKVLKLLQALQDEGVEYVLIGALALTVHGIVRATQDIDIFLSPESSNIHRLRTALSRVFPDDASIQEISAEDLAGDYPAIRYYSPDGSLTIDFLSRLGDTFRYEDIRLEEKYYERVRVRVATPEMLYKMKKDTLRLQDRADASVLKERFRLAD